MRVTSLCRRLLDLDGITVTDVELEGEVVVCEVRLRRRRLACPRCAFTTRARYNTRTVDSQSRGLDLGRRPNTTQTATALDRWCSVASRSRLLAFVRVAKTIRKFREGILAAIRLGHQQRTSRGTEQPRQTDSPPRIRLPLRPSRADPGDALLRPHRPMPPSRTGRPMTHTHAGRATILASRSNSERLPFASLELPCVRRPSDL